ncbi:MAG TPA: PAS domain-containing protein, partial [Terriglobales bacterium]|nr:PAS domain-containing protein [Terriglobales bacterium]
TTLAAPAATASPATAPVRPAAGATNLQSLAEQVIVQRFAPASVLTNEKGDILYFGGRTGNYLEPAAGRAQLNVFAMAREGLRLQLVNAFRSALRKDQPVTVRNVAVGGDAKKKLIHLSVEKLDRPQGLRGTVMIVFEDAGKATSGKGQRPVLSRAGQIRLDELEQDLQHALEDTQSTREEMQTSQEELRSTNEELQSTNEELQSSNEELTTSKEEMQSLNEELQTLNHELQAKVEELSRSNNDMKNLLNSTDIATLFLDGSLNVRRFTPETTKIIKLLPSDAGRPITDISCELDYADLAGDAREVLRTLISKESIVSAANGHWYVIRILPYRTIGNVIDGVVITFTDITAAKLLETGLRDQAEGLRRMTETLPNLLWSARPNGSWDYLSPQWVAYTGISEAEQLGYGWCEQLHSDDQRRVKERWKASVRSSDVFEADARLRNSTGGYRWFRMRARPLQDAAGAISYWYGSATDVEDLIGAKSRPR